MKIFNYDSSTKQLTPLSTEGSSSVVTDTNGAVGTAGQSSNTQALMDYATGGVKTLVGSDSGKSARTIAAEEVAEQLVPENAGESLDTLQEIAAWIQSHPGDAASMNQRIANLETAVPFMLYIQNGTYGYKNSNDEFVAFKSQADIDAAVAAAAAVGTATAADVLAGKTFSNSSAKDIAGTMPDNSTRTSNGEVPGIQNNYPNEPVRNGISLQYNTGTDGVRRFAMAPPKGYYPGAASYVGAQAQTKTCTPSTSQQTISPDSGKVLESVTVAAIPTQRSLGTAATGSGIDRTGPYVYMPYGWWPEYSGKAGSSYTYMTAAQAVAACPKQEKTVTSSVSAQTVTPDSGKLLSKVTVNAMTNLSSATRYQHYSNNSTPTILGDAGFFTTVYDRISKANLGDYFEIRYNGSPNKDTSNNTTGNGYITTNTLIALPSQTKTITASRSAQTVSPDSNKVLKSVTVNKYPDASGTFTTSTNGSAVDMGATNNYRYVNTTGVYNAGNYYSTKSFVFCHNAAYNKNPFIGVNINAKTAKVAASWEYNSVTLNLSVADNKWAWKSYTLSGNNNVTVTGPNGTIARIEVHMGSSHDMVNRRVNLTVTPLT